MYRQVIHEFEPIYDKFSEILILGSIPSVKSREVSFYYGHPQNRFWRVLEKIYNSPSLATKEEKTIFLKENKIALWDVIKSCEITGSDDSSIKNPQLNDLSEITNTSKVSRIYFNGKKAEAIYKKLYANKPQLKTQALPSTSPANAAYSLERLAEIWGKALLQG